MVSTAAAFSHRHGAILKPALRPVHRNMVWGTGLSSPSGRDGVSACPRAHPARRGL